MSTKTGFAHVCCCLSKGTFEAHAFFWVQELDSNTV
ncbi:uncharacterized protein ARMOST_17026 [Armillaria ostoyae]|uniref:Uncharacterized protein n=1 Tax=Armillaria ostoyae TaxID=47428 RepID=A0A284RXV3_ARMOS|nr:uncharacterized protein ARMOST_17026 [Armillaria ostoyae]